MGAPGGQAWRCAAPVEQSVAAGGRGRLDPRFAGRRDLARHLTRCRYFADLGGAVTVVTVDPVGLVLGGGSHLGALQVGQIRALCDFGVEVDYIIGCSVGALNGAYMAAGFTTERAEGLAAIWRDVAGDPVFDTGVQRVWSILRQRPSLSRPDKVMAVIDRASPVARIEELAVEFEAVTCNLTRGRVEYHTSGDLRTRLAASSAIPGLLPPVTIDGDVHVDGGVLDVLPWRRARVRRPDATIIVLDCHQHRSGEVTRDGSALSILLSSFALARHHGVRDGLDTDPSVIVLPGIGRDGIDTFADAVASIDESYAATRSFIDAGGLDVEAARDRTRAWLRRWSTSRTGRSRLSADAGPGRWRR